LASAAAWFYVGPFVVLAALALLVFGFAILAVAVQALAALLRHAAV
jgi:hypothetical protein